MYKIYRALNLKTGKSYIGQTRRELHQRIYGHTTARNRSRFAKALLESNEFDWRWTVLDTAQTCDEAHEKECYYIWKFKAITTGYNGTMGKAHHSELTKEKISISKRGTIPWNAGRKGVYSQEAIDKMSKARLGAKIIKTPEWSEKNKRSVQEAVGRKVKNLTTGEIYPSVAEAARLIGASHCHVKRILSGKRNSPTIKIEYFTKE